MDTNCEKFTPYDKTYKCANKTCRNTWIVRITELLHMMICGGGAKVCPQCEQAGYVIYSGSGDGSYHLWQNGEEIDVYNYNTAYKIVHTPQDVERSFFAELAEGHPPATDCFSSAVLKDYIDDLIALRLIDEDRRSAPGYSRIFNDYCKEHGFDVSLNSLPSDEENALWFRYQSPKWSGLLCMRIDILDFEFDECVVKEPEE
jgi:hypothetical protein